jgi:class 3 adenylate cyclase
VVAATVVDLRTALITDIVGSTAKQVELGDCGWRDVLLAHRRLVRDSLVRWHGYENDTAGDGFYVTFADATDAVRCALEIEQTVRSLDIELRAGLHRGTCELAEDRCSGLTVSIAARVAAFAAGSQVLVTDAVRTAVDDERIRYDLCCVRELRGVPGRWWLWSVAEEPSRWA